MANEFVARNGIIAKANSSITGTLDVSGNITMGTALVATRSWVTSTALTGYATENYVTTAINNLIDAAPGTLNTLNELAAALGDDPNFATTISNTIATKLPLAGGSMTGNINWTSTDKGLVWAMNSDGASIKFYNTADGDTNSRLEFNTLDNNNEYFRWTHSPSGGTLYESMKLVPNSSGNSVLTVQGSIYAGANKVATESWVTSQNYLTSYTNTYVTSAAFNTSTGVLTLTRNDAGTVTVDLDGKYAEAAHTHSAADITSGTLASARLSGTYAISITGNAATATSASSASTATNVNGSSGQLLRRDNRTIAPNEINSGYLQFGFTSFNNNNTAPWADYLHLRSYTDASGGNDNLLVISKSTKSMRLYQQSWNSGTAYSSYVDFWTTGDFTGTDVTNWNTAYSWGNHASAGYLTSYTETDPIYTASSWYTTTNNSSNWNTAYSWGNHAGLYDNYGSWNLKTNGVQRTTVQSGGTLDIVAGTNVSVSYGAGGVVTINSTDTNTNNYLTGLSFATGTGVLTATRSGLSDLTVSLDGRYALSSHTHSYLPLSGGTLTGSLTIGTSEGTNNNKVYYNNVKSYTLPAAGTRMALMNIGASTTVRVTLTGSENGYFQPINLFITRNNTTVTTIIRESVRVHTHSNDIYFSTDASGNVYAEKTLATGRPVVIRKVEQLTPGTFDILDGSLLDAGVGVDQSVIGIGNTNVGWNTVWHSGNDGSGSGLDADLLDGQHGSYYAPLSSPTFTGTPAAPTATAGTNTTQIATTAYVTTAISNLIGGAPAALDTLNELAAAINDDASYASTITSALSLKAPLASPALTGTPTAPTASTATNNTQIATTAFVKAQGYLTSYTETDTLATVTGRGATTTTAITIQGGWASTILDGDNVVLRKPNYSGGGWARTLLNFQEYDATSLFQIGGYGTNNTMSYGYLGSAYNTPTFRWYADKTVVFDGKVGIGTTSPDQKLQVSGSDSVGIRVSGGTNNRFVDLTGTSLDFYTTSTSGWAMGNIVRKNSDGSALGYISGAYGDVNILTYTYYGGTAYNNAAMYILSSNKNVGIGTSSPAEKLTVAGTIQAVGGTSNSKYVNVYVNDSWAYYTTNVANTYMNAELRVDTGLIGSYDEDLQLRTAGTTRIYASTSGNVGIGTTSPGYKLDVSGDINASGEVRAGQGKFDEIKNRLTGNTIIDFDTSNNVGIATASSFGRLQIAGASTNPDLSTVTAANVSLVVSNSDVGYGTMFATYPSGIGALQQRRTNTNTYYDFVLQPHGGRIGIGTTSPFYTLDVNGNARFSSTVTSTGFVGSLSGNATTASALATARTITLSGAVTGSASFDGSANITISTTATPDPTLTINGDASGSATFTNLGNATLTLTIADDSHNHIISNVDGLQTALNGKAGVSGTSNPQELAFFNSQTDITSQPELMWTGTDLMIIGGLQATTKSFNIEHPTKPGKRLVYGVLEGPEHGVYTRGRTTERTIILPEEWTGLVDQDSITVQLTAVGKPTMIYVVDIKDNKVFVDADAENIEYFYYVQGTRKDIEKLEIEQ